ncbi:MAG: hypothetical protein H7A40_00875 [Chlamydiales bacterium]|nr:hypothetical protein [Chlamydiales bacterium]
MRKLLFLACFQAILFHGICQAACPASIPPLPALPIPIGVPPAGTCSTPTPDMVAGYLPVTFVNDTGISADDIYIAVLVNKSTQYLSFSGSPYQLATISNFTPTTYLSASQYSYPLSTFETDPNVYTFYIPNTGKSGDAGSNYMLSSRILISLQQPLTYFINNLGVLQLPSETLTTDDNYYILNDKIEFDLGSNNLNRLNLNLTGVDFFGLPISVQANYMYLDGSTYYNVCSVTGMPSSVTLDDVFTQYNSSLSSLASPFDTHWGGLVATYTNPPSSGGDLCNLRIFAPATAMGSTQTQTNPSKVSFPTNYFLSSVASPDTCTWFNAVWRGKTKSKKQAFYENRKPIPYLVLDATTGSQPATAKGYEVEDGSFRFVVSGGSDAGKTVIFPLPTSSKAFFTGAVSDYTPAIGGNASSATQKQLLKVFATSIIAGFFPLDCKPDQITLNNTYLQNHSSAYFANNSTLTSALDTCACVDNIPWYDFYSRTLLTIGTPNLFYTSAYSDFLGADGTIVITSLASQNDDATITVTINDCSTGVNFPDPYSDTDVYNITVGIPSDATVQFATSEGGPFGAIPATAAGNAFFLQVTYNAGIYSGQTFVSQVAPLAQIFHPTLPGQGVITTTGSNASVVIGASPK